MASILVNNTGVQFTDNTGKITTQSNIYPMVGTIIMWAGKDISIFTNKYLVCDGRQLSTTEYATLYSIIGYTYGGSGDYFNLPNLVKRFPIGSMATKMKINVDNTEYNSSGGQNIILNHNYPHTHNVNYAGFSLIGRAGINVWDKGYWRVDSSESTGNDMTSTLTTNAVNATSSKEFYPPYCIISYIIRVK